MAAFDGPPRWCGSEVRLLGLGHDWDVGGRFEISEGLSGKDSQDQEAGRHAVGDWAESRRLAGYDCKSSSIRPRRGSLDIRSWRSDRINGRYV